MSAFVTAKDLLTNAFAITVHKSILIRFARAIQQRQVILARYGIPAEIIELVVLQNCGGSGHDTQQQQQQQQDYEMLAYCFYHFISLKYWEDNVGSKQWDVVKSDFEDRNEKRVQCYVSKVPVCANSIVLRATIGYKVLHTVVWCAPPGVIAELLPALNATKQTRRILFTSDQKVSTGDDRKGAWCIAVDLRRSCPTASATSFTARQLSDVVEFLVTIKPRHELEPAVFSVLGKLPIAGTPTSVASIAGNLDDDVDDDGGARDPTDALFGKALRFAAPTVVGGFADPAPLPRPPATYMLPPDTVSGPTIAPYVPVVVPQPRVVHVADATNVFTIDALSIKTNQSMGCTVQDPVSHENVRVYVQFVDVNVRMLNRSDRQIVFTSPMRAVCRSAADAAEAPVVRSARTANWDSRDGILSVGPGECEAINIRCEFEVRGRSSGSDNFERSLLDGREFPQPACFEITVVEAHSNASAVVAVCQYNVDRGLETKERFLQDVTKASNPDDVLLYVAADDCDNLRRYAAAVFIDHEENVLVVGRRNARTLVSLLVLQSAAYECLMSGDDTYELSNFSDGDHYRAWLLLSKDLHPSMVYGVRLQITTPTSQSVGHAHVRFGDRLTWLKSPPSSSADTATATPSTSTSSSWVHIPSSSIITPSQAREAILNSGDRPFVPAAPSIAQPAGDDGVAASVGSQSSTLPSQPQSMGAPSPSASMGYTIMYDSPIGSGAYGSVYRAFDLQNGRTVAVKETRVPNGSAIRCSPNTARQTSATPSASGGSSSSNSTSHQKEFDILVRLSHPNIVNVFDMDLLDDVGVFRVFMEWMPGGSVASVIAQGGGFRLHENVVRKFARDALHGLAYLHQLGILHLDVKPQNMLVSQEGSVKLADFGTTLFLNKALASVSAQSVVGTPAYMAPEIISAGKYYRGSDMWAWASSVTEMASGKPPWSHLPEHQRFSALPLMFQIATARPPNHCPLIPSHLSEELKEILSACFAPTMSLRPTADALLATEYFARETLPLDIEPMEAFYAKARTHNEARSTSPNTEWSTLTSTGAQCTEEIVVE